jgi:threonine/homoserine/homoserine lactone efflux protein
MTFAALWIVFSLSFVVALSGALMPGPLLTYTIARTVRTPRRGWTVGPRAIAGHAALEAVILCGLLLGVMDLFRKPLAIRIIGTAGGAFLVWSGVMMIVTMIRGRARAGSLEAGEPREPGRESPLMRLGPVASGVLVSLSNPYWWVWWVTVGAASLVRFDVTFERWPAILAFYAGHEAGDLGWYATVSTLVHIGRRGIPKVVYDGLLGVCAVAIVGFGAWLAISAYR